MARPRVLSAARLRLILALFVCGAVVVTLALVLAPAPETPAASAPITVPTTSPPTEASVPTTVAPSTTTATEPEPTTTLEQVPLPDPMPADPYAATSEIVLGQIEIPKLGVIGKLEEGITLTAINRGPGHWPGTPLPGGRGNLVIAGHRTTYSKPFSRVDELTPGDVVIFRMPTETITYQVRGVIIVPAQNIGIAAQNDAHTATLFACHPRGSATHRIVVKLRLLGPDGLPVDPDEALPPVDAGADPVTGTTLLVRAAGTQPAASDPLAGTGQ
jgi:sortase A